MNAIKIPIYGLLLLAAVFVLFPQQDVVMTIRNGMPAISLALPKFITRSSAPSVTAASEEVYQILSDDLKYSRIFQLLPKSYYSYIRPLDPKNIFFKDWESIQANILFVGEVSESSDSQVIFEGKLYDVKSQRFIFGKRYQSKRDVLRYMAHKMADEILRVYGEKPLFTSRIVFISNRDGNDELYMMDYDGANQTRLTFNKVLDYMPTWSADSKRIAYISYQNHTAGLFLLDIYEGRRSEVTLKGVNSSPSFSPDGKKLAFCSTMHGNAEIYVASSDGDGIKRITFNKAIDTAPSWSPTSREIAFVSDRGGTPQIYIMDAEGSNIRRLSFGGNHNDSPAWSPNGDRIVYVSQVDQICDLYVYNLRTSQIMKLTENRAHNESPSWSPDGRHIVFTSNLSGTVQIHTIDYDGANMRGLTSRGSNKLPDWSN
ncbi:MAG: Tol-Pal system beta propeller repeat protein TolB [Candidatus Aminicenantales bacterium]